MSAAAAGSSQTAVVESATRKSEKSHKRAKSEHKKKRAREEDDAVVVEETPRKSKKTKGELVDNDSQSALPIRPLMTADEPSKDRKKKKSGQGVGGGSRTEDEKLSGHAKLPGPVLRDATVFDSPDAQRPATTAHGADKKRKEKKSKKQRVQDDSERGAERMPASDVLEADKAGASPSDAAVPEKRRKSKTKAANEGSSQEAMRSEDTHDLDFPFFTQSISLYVPFFPVGFDKPLTNVASQHLDPLLNHYSPLLRGVLLSYSNLNLSDRPAKASIRHPPTDQTPTVLHSIDEYAVGFGWLTFDAHLFVPSRGKWMEGVLQLQSEGHIGVVCWNKFNASIEAKRLPKGWSWVDLAKGSAKPSNSPSPDKDEMGQQDQESEDMLDGEELQVVEQIHTTGYWVNERGRKVSGKLRFRIKNFDVGLAGDYGYLSIEGTCLDDDDERALAARERQLELARREKQNPSGLLRPLSRRLPEFGVTKFGRQDEEEDDRQRAVPYKGSRPGTPDD